MPQAVLAQPIWWTALPVGTFAFDLAGCELENNRMVVYSLQTEHHVNDDVRITPIFRELLPHLRQVFERAELGTAFVITRYYLSANSKL